MKKFIIEESFISYADIEIYAESSKTKHLQSITEEIIRCLIIPYRITKMIIIFLIFVKRHRR